MIQEHHIETVRTARYYLDGQIGPAITDVWFACHGYGQLAARFASEFECISAPNRLIVVPEATSRFYVTASTGVHTAETPIGSTWMTREDRETDIADYVRYLDTLYDDVMSKLDASKVRITVLGFSQGGATANRWLTRGTARADRLLMWGCLLPQDADLEEQAEYFRTTDLIIVYGTRDQFATTGVVESYEKLLKKSNIPYRLMTFDGGHRMDRETLKLLTGETGS
jgi:predicted esterase